MSDERYIPPAQPFDLHGFSEEGQVEEWMSYEAHLAAQRRDATTIEIEHNGEIVRSLKVLPGQTVPAFRGTEPGHYRVLVDGEPVDLPFVAPAPEELTMPAPEYRDNRWS
ncbi:MAG: hypothetical protein AAGA99_26590 [Actinomycetota bacterium]